MFHAGSAVNAEEISSLKEVALEWIEKNNPQKFLFPIARGKNESSLISLEKCKCLGFRYQLLYDTLWRLTTQFKFHLLPDSKILNDLVIARIVAPSSKLEALRFIDEFFGIKHQRSKLYRQLEGFVDFLTTLYFESFEGKRNWVMNSNTEMIHKANLLLGIKGYYTNCSNLSNAEIISHYKNLWHVEQAFRISKSDLKAKTHLPLQRISHKSSSANLLHGISNRQIYRNQNQLLNQSGGEGVKKSINARIYDEINKREVVMKPKISDEVKKIL